MPIAAPAAKKPNTGEAAAAFPVEIEQFVNEHAKIGGTQLSLIDVGFSSFTKSVLIKVIGPPSFSLSKSRTRFDVYQTNRFRLA